MLLTRALAPSTAPATRGRGVEYFTKGAVVHFDPQSTFAYAVVRGTEDYVVRIELAGRELRCTCTCPFFNDRLETCKHLWAVALACDARGVLQVPDAIGPNDVRFVGVPLDDSAEDSGWSADDPEFHVARPRAGSASPRSAGSRAAGWKQALATIAAQAQEQTDRPPVPPGQILYVIDLAASTQAHALSLHLLRQEQKRNGEWGSPRAARVSTGQVSGLPEPDRTIFERLAGARPAYAWPWGSLDVDVPSPLLMRGTVAIDMLPTLCATGRCRLALTEIASVRPQDSPLMPIAWLDAPPLTCELRIVRDDEAGVYAVDAALAGGDTRIALADIVLLLDEGLALTRGTAMRVHPGGVMPWMHQLLERGPLRIPVGQGERLRDALLASGATDVAGLPDELRTMLVEVAPTPHLILHSPRHEHRLLDAELTFSYDGGPALPASSAPLAPTRDAQVMARRAADAERAAHARLRALGVRSAWNSWERRQTLQVAAADVPRLARELVREGWHVEADGQRYRLATATPKLDVRSGVDWFELRGGADFDGQQVSLPQLLDAVRQRHTTVLLGDGTRGILPEEWLRDLAPLALGQRDGDHVRFQRSQVALLDALLAAKPGVSWDDRAAAARDRLRAFDAITPLDPPPSFAGELREYQREALGWLLFLREFGFGGCLADDMGLGKTVVVLALLEARRQASGGHRSGPAALAGGGAPVRPVQLAAGGGPFRSPPAGARFLRRRPHANACTRLRTATSCWSPTARSGATPPRSRTSRSTTSSSTRRRRSRTRTRRRPRPRACCAGQHRLALSGTPVENRLGGSLEPVRVPQSRAAQRRHGVRPRLLRRRATPTSSGCSARACGRSSCDAPRSRWRRNCRRRRSRRSSANSSDRSGRSTTSCAITTAARCSARARDLAAIEDAGARGAAAPAPGGVSSGAASTRPGADEPSAKLDLLLPRLVEAIEEGHKALVFSQFTSFLALVRTRLDERGHRLRVPGRPNQGSRGAGRAVPARRVVPAVPDQPEGRRRRAEPDGRGLRVHPRPVVEPGGGGAGRGPRRTASARRGACSPTG